MLDVNGNKIKSGKVMIGFGVFFLIEFSFIPYMMVTEGINASIIMAGLTFLIPGIIMIVKGNNRRVKYNLHRTYVTAFAHYPNCNYIELAHRLNKDPQIVEKDLRRLMTNQLLSAAFINEKLTLRNTNPASKGPERSGSGEYVSIVCSSCNGINKIPKYRGGECVYCGTTLPQ